MEGDDPLWEVRCARCAVLRLAVVLSWRAVTACGVHDVRR